MIKNLPVRLAEVGKIKIGRKGDEREKRDGSGTFKLPVKVDYFIITTLHRGADGNFTPDLNLMKKIDPKNTKPRKLRILLPYDKISLNLFSEYSHYAGRKRICFGDGEKATKVFLDGEKKKEIKRETIECPCNLLEDGICKPHGILSCILRDHFQLGGVYQFRTTSYNSIINIISGLKQIQKMTQGILAMIPLVMSIQPQTVKDKNGFDRRIYAVNIMADVKEWQELYEQAISIAKIRSESAISIRQLEGKVEEQMKKQRNGEVIEDAEYTPINEEDSPEVQSDVNAEFSPETIDESSVEAASKTETEIETKIENEKDELSFLDGSRKKEGSEPEPEPEPEPEQVAVEEPKKQGKLW